MVAALALAIVALPPVVNGIMEHAARQADVDWLKEGSLQGTPPPDTRPPPGEHDARGNASAPPRLPPPPPCTPTNARPQQETVGPTDLGLLRGQLTLTTQAGDVGVLAHVEGRGVTGQPSFEVDEAGQPRWTSDRQLYVQQDVSQPPGDEGAFHSPAPRVAWALTWDLTGVVFQGFQFTLSAVRCAEVS